ncbi:hypothetical protein CNECB9_4260013 [Cupriavidus necator]|uniref:Uncharacterized protein n=1 Tax=Cupriavidus necator TaxID=106590 RepID=A0A1K0IL39_CUPNE|nr:hypothetical protein CNECB9_4260013 [Cupriavidus necator]
MGGEANKVCASVLHAGAVFSYYGNLFCQALRILAKGIKY